MSNIINRKSFKRVIAYGCSFTAGDEIVDHLLLNISFEKCNELKSKFPTQEMFYKHYNLVNFKGNKFMENYSWSGQLAQMLNLPYQSRAVPGCSMGHIYFKIYNDYLKKEISSDDLILVGITSPNRIMYWNPDLSMLDSTPINCYLEKIDSFGQKAIMDVYDDNILILNYFSHIQNVYSLKNILNIRMQHMLSDNVPNHTQFRYNIRPELDKIIRDIHNRCDNILCPDITLQNKYTTELGRCGFFHPPLEAHTYLAEVIYDRCVK